MKKSFSSRLPGLLITILLTVAVTLFMAILMRTKLLPGKLLLVAAGVFLLFVLSVCLLTWDMRKTGRMITGSVMTMGLLITLMVGTPYLTKAVNTLGNLTGVKVEVADVGVYVKNNSPVKDLSGLVGKNLGILDVLDRTNTDMALKDLQAEVGTLHTTGYDGLTELADGLLNEEVDAICSIMHFWICCPKQKVMRMSWIRSTRSTPRRPKV